MREGSRESRPAAERDHAQISLEPQAAAALERAMEVARGELPIAPVAADPHSMHDALGEARDMLASRLEQPSRCMPRAELVELCQLVVELTEIRTQVREQVLGARLGALLHVRQALSRLRGSGSVRQVLDRATAELCRSCDFDRAILFRVEGSEMVAESVHFEGHPEWAAELRAHVRAQRPRLTHRLVEAEMVRRHQPMLVRDPQNDPRTFRPLVVASDTRSYVAAPIMPEGRVIGLMHADSYFTGRTMDELDRDTLATFTEGLGYAIERAILVDRLHTQRDEVSRMIRNTDQIISEVFELDMEPTHAPVQGDARRASSSIGWPSGNAAVARGRGSDAP